MQIITSGSTYIDIDAYAGCIAYAELLQAQNKQAIAVSTAPLNESVSKTIRSWQAPLQTDYKPSKNDTFTLIDVSDPAHFDKIVNLAQVDKVIDHHPGFEQFWHERIGNSATIEFIGAACTLVYEAWQKAGLLEKMSVHSARLLVCGILDNTLNFGAKVTTQRDSSAYKVLLAQANLPDDWTAQYFTECQESILKDVAAAIKNDLKTISFKLFERPICVGQLAVWNGRQMLAEHQNILKEVLKSIRPDWFMNLISINEQKSYFLTDNSDVQKWLTNLLGVHFDGSVAIADRLWLRKEVIKLDHESVKMI